MTEALVIHAPHELQVETRPVPSLTQGEVLVRVEAGGICGSDLHYYHHGGFGAVRLKHPMILGHEIAGRIADKAPDVTGLEIGDLVAVNPGLPCQHCRQCLAGRSNHCTDMRFYGSAMRNPHIDGAFRRDLVCKARQCVRAEHRTPAELALSEPFAVALHAVSRAGALMGKRVLVTGAGPIGALVALAARLNGACEVIVTDILDEPLAVVRQLGADRVINGRVAPQALTELAGSIDVLIECSGNEQALRSGLALMQPCGTIVQLGLGDDVTLPQSRIVTGELTWTGSFRFKEEFALAVTLIDSGKADLSALVTHRFALDQASAAFDLASDRRQAMKILLEF
ncbi:L-idonate 5-dehydrogenase [Asaia krungthepensis]|uniref:Threonine dehydrogenase n=1 Tax=Asaia krungthepensis NRIC 0535 TaxID=1307925 RepID=A0ABQ0Q6V7_9PROT|nr:L-idonate 5-dehydrogenase [Asaia krungthepensis]GBQ94008.1 threonine dehydrogenase [Asaia krungthepensis NRIC 0535]